MKPVLTVSHRCLHRHHVASRSMPSSPIQWPFILQSQLSFCRKTENMLGPLPKYSSVHPSINPLAIQRTLRHIDLNLFWMLDSFNIHLHHIHPCSDINSRQLGNIFLFICCFLIVWHSADYSFAFVGRANKYVVGGHCRGALSGVLLMCFSLSTHRLPLTGQATAL